MALDSVLSNIDAQPIRRLCSPFVLLSKGGYMDDGQTSYSSEETTGFQSLAQAQAVLTYATRAGEWPFRPRRSPAGGSGVDRRWTANAEFLSPRYTTRLTEIVSVRA